VAHTVVDSELRLGWELTELTTPAAAEGTGVLRRACQLEVFVALEDPLAYTREGLARLYHQRDLGLEPVNSCLLVDTHYLADIGVVAQDLLASVAAVVAAAVAPQETDTLPRWLC
jgi:hypothetical protein